MHIFIRFIVIIIGLVLNGATTYAQSNGNAGTVQEPPRRATVAPINIGKDQSLPRSHRTVPQGAPLIDCVAISDSRCAGAITLPGLPTCTVTVMPNTIDMNGAASVQATVSANCSTGVTKYQWTQTAGNAPTGQTSMLTYFNTGSYCYTVAGQNPLLSMSFGTTSPQSCLTITNNSGACSGGQSWNGAACVCPFGQTWNGSLCVTSSNTLCVGASPAPANTTCAGWGCMVNNTLDAAVGHCNSQAMRFIRLIRRCTTHQLALGNTVRNLKFVVLAPVANLGTDQAALQQEIRYAWVRPLRQPTQHVPAGVA
jgi:hypothetical protein